MKKQNNLFWVFGILQAITLGLITFFILQTTTIGKDTSTILSILFPLFTLIVAYMVYSKK
jgi:hypothetical protein